MNVNVSDDVAGVSCECLQKLRNVPHDPATRQIEALILNQRHSHITLLLTLRNLFSRFATAFLPRVEAISGSSLHLRQ